MPIAIAKLELPISVLPDVRMSDEEFFAFCQANDGLRVERSAEGMLRMMSPAGSGSGNRNAEIIVQLGVWARADGRGLCFDSNCGFTLPDGSVLSPDAAWMRREPWLALTEEQRSSFAPVCPDFVLELRSPSDALPPLREKMLAWIQNGAQSAWLVDPQERTVTIYRPGELPERHVEPSTVQGTGPILGFELAMEWVWGKVS